MSTPAHRVQYSYAEYKALEASSNVKHEYFDGQIFAMAGGTPDHAALAATVIGLLFSQLRGGRCRVLDSDLRIRIEETGLTTYPDVSVVCGPREVSSEDPHAITNPTLIVEVTSKSKSSEDYDRGDKFDHYKRLPSLQQYVVISHHARSVEIFSRGNGWRGEAITDGGVAELAAIGARLDVRELYQEAAEAR